MTEVIGIINIFFNPKITNGRLEVNKNKQRQDFMFGILTFEYKVCFY